MVLVLCFVRGSLSGVIMYVGGGYVFVCVNVSGTTSVLIRPIRFVCSCLGLISTDSGKEWQALSVQLLSS